MSNERIDRILKENNLEFISFAYPNMYPRTRKAMEQYGSEMYDEGLSEAYTLTNRLRSLAKAQKEYIELLADRYAGLLTVAAPHGYKESRESIEKGIKLRVQIKALES